MDPITPLTKQELENRGWQMTTVENPTPDPGPTVVQQMRLEFATIKAYKGSEGRSRTLRFKLFGVAEVDLPNIRLEFGRFIKTRHTVADSLAGTGAEPSADFAYNKKNTRYLSKGFIVPNPARTLSSAYSTRKMGCVDITPFNVPVDDEVGINQPTTWRKPYQDAAADVCLIGRTKLQASSINPNEYVAVEPNPDKQISTGNPKGTILTLTDFIVPFVSLYMVDGSRKFFASHYCGNVTTANIQSGTHKDSISTYVSLRFVKCGFRLVNVVTGDTSPILEFVPIITLVKPTPGWGVIAHVSYGSYNPKRYFTAR